MRLNPFQRSLLLIVATLGLPIVVLVVSAVYTSLETDRTQIEQQTLDRTRHIDALIDAAVQADLAAMHVLAMSREIKDGDWRAAYERVREVAETTRQWRTVILSDLGSGEEVFNLKRPYSEQRLGLAPEIRGEARADAIVTGSITRQGPGCPCVYLHVPISGPRESRHLLSVGLDPVVFQKILMAQVPEATVAAIVDRKGNFLARSIDFPNRVGTPATEFVRRAVTKGGEGFYQGRTYEGLANYTAFHTSPLTGWSTHIAVASSLLDRPRFLSSITLLVGTLAVLALSFAVIGYTLRETGAAEAGRSRGRPGAAAGGARPAHRRRRA